MLVAAKLKKGLSREGTEITIQVSLRVVKGKVRLAQMKVHNGKVKQVKVEQVAKAITLYLSAFTCLHYWKIDFPHKLSNMRGLKKYSDGTCIRCNTVRRKFSNYLPENAHAPGRKKEDIVFVRVPKNKKENRLLLTFSSFVVVSVDGNKFKLRKGQLEK